MFGKNKKAYNIKGQLAEALSKSKALNSMISLAMSYGERVVN